MFRQTDVNMRGLGVGRIHDQDVICTTLIQKLCLISVDDVHQRQYVWAFAAFVAMTKFAMYVLYHSGTDVSRL